MVKIESRNDLRKVRHKRVRCKIKGTASVPRLNVFRSSKNIFAQIIDDEKGKTLVSASSIDKEFKKPEGSGKVNCALEVGKMVGKRALAKGISEVVFDRGGYDYHGRVKALADGAREAGLKF
jgi:large subunit ribosomal protein L18